MTKYCDLKFFKNKIRSAWRGEV